MFIHSRTGRAGNHGYAYTFITPEQGRYAGDIIKAFELAGQSSRVPPELTHLLEEQKQLAESVGFNHYKVVLFIFLYKP